MKLTQDITPDERIVVTGNKNITIDLAEKKITSTADVAIVNDGNRQVDHYRQRYGGHFLVHER